MTSVHRYTLIIIPHRTEYAALASLRENQLSAFSSFFSMGALIRAGRSGYNPLAPSTGSLRPHHAATLIHLRSWIRQEIFVSKCGQHSPILRSNVQAARRPQTRISLASSRKPRPGWPRTTPSAAMR